jgi:hypothetical protein
MGRMIRWGVERRKKRGEMRGGRYGGERVFSARWKETV